MARDGIAGPDDGQHVDSSPSFAAVAAVAPLAGPEGVASEGPTAAQSAHDPDAGSVERPAAKTPARPATAVPRVVEPKRPYHVGVALGVATGLYAVSLALVSRMQIDHDQALIVDRQPVRDAIELLDRHHDAMDSDLNVAASAYDDAAGGYNQLVVELADVHQDVASLAKRLRTIRRLAVVDGSGLASLPKISSAGGGTISQPAKATSRTSHKSAPPPPVDTNTGASGGG